MVEMFKSWPVIFQVIAVNSAFIAVIFLAIIAARNKLNFSGNSKGISFSFGKKDKDEEKSPHAICPNRHDASESMKRIRKIERSVMEIKYFITVKDQMNVVESLVKTTMGRFLEVYTSLLKKKGNEDPISTKSAQSYIVLLKVVEKNLIDQLRFFVRENHFADKTEQQFDSYVDMKTNELKTVVTSTLNDFYKCDMDITRGELYDANEDKILRGFENMVRDCLHKCRLIAINTAEKIDLLEDECESIFSKFTA